MARASAALTLARAARAISCEARVEHVVAAVGSPSATCSTSGTTPLPRIEVPSEVRYSPTVRSSAPPASSSITSWKTPLPKVRSPMTVAEVVLLDRGGEDLRCRGGVAVDQHRHRRQGIDRAAGRLERLLGAGAPLDRHDRARLLEDRGGQDRLVEEAAAVAAEVEHDPLGAVGEQAVDRLAELAVGAAAEGEELDVGDLAPVDASPSATRPRGSGRWRARPRARAACRTSPSISVIVTSVPGLPLIRLAAAVEETPAIDSPSTATISSPTRCPAFSAGVSSKTRAMRRPRFDSMTLRPIPANSPEVDCWKRR